ncbi:hypothetical protein [Bacillus thuringiensis]|uniref:hypothetical protein n=1 Tax=Bacillus thuringiensis TaxID=1428 RepID=UPI000BFE45A5|nr:hypothetical protein [Bacillus thuringiensis]PGT89922.1 hypothetical protein COD17_09230 [Bacillus thuringiensis]
MVIGLGAVLQKEQVKAIAPTDIVQLELYEDKVVNTFPNLDIASYYVLETERKEKTVSVIKRNLLVGMRRKDGRYGKYRWVSGKQYVESDYGKYKRTPFPKGERLVQMFVDDNEAVNIFNSLEMASYVTGIPENRLKMALYTRSGYTGGYRFATFTDYLNGKCPATILPSRIRTQGVRDYPKQIDDGVIIYSKDLTVKGRLPLAMAKEEYNIDGMAELVLEEHGRLPRGGDILQLEHLFWERQRKDERLNPLTERYIVEVDSYGQLVKEYHTYRALANELELTVQEVKSLVGTVYKGRQFRSKIDYCSRG